MMFTGSAMLLWFAATLCFVAFGIDYAEGDPSPDNLYMGGALTFLVLVSGIFTFYQENKSSKIMESRLKFLKMEKFVKSSPKMLWLETLRTSKVVTKLQLISGSSLLMD